MRLKLAAAVCLFVGGAATAQNQPLQGHVETGRVIPVPDPAPLPIVSCEANNAALLRLIPVYQAFPSPVREHNLALLDAAIQQCVPVQRCQANPNACNQATAYHNAQRWSWYIAQPPARYFPTLPAPDILKAYIDQSAAWLPQQPQTVQDELAPKLAAMQQQCQSGTATTRGCADAFDDYSTDGRSPALLLKGYVNIDAFPPITNSQTAAKYAGNVANGAPRAPLSLRDRVAAIEAAGRAQNACAQSAPGCSAEMTTMFGQVVGAADGGSTISSLNNGDVAGDVDFPAASQPWRFMALCSQGVRQVVVDSILHPDMEPLGEPARQLLQERMDLVEQWRQLALRSANAAASVNRYLINSGANRVTAWLRVLQMLTIGVSVYDEASHAESLWSVLTEAPETRDAMINLTKPPEELGDAYPQVIRKSCKTIAVYLDHAGEVKRVMFK